jgi:hypothetical protein
VACGLVELNMLVFYLVFSIAFRVGYRRNAAGGAGWIGGWIRFVRAIASEFGNTFERVSSMFDRLKKKFQQKKSVSETSAQMESLDNRQLLSGAWTALDALALHDNGAAASSHVAQPLAKARRSPITWQYPSWLGNYQGQFYVNGVGTPINFSLLSTPTTSYAYLVFVNAGTGAIVLQGKAIVNYGDVVQGVNGHISMTQATTSSVVALNLTYVAKLGTIQGTISSASFKTGKIVQGTFYCYPA